MTQAPIFYQLFEAETSTYTYLFVDSETGTAVLVDPVLETVERDQRLLTELGARLAFVLETHVHADHVTGASELKKRNAGCRIGVSRIAGASGADVALDDGMELAFGGQRLRVLATPGHTDTCLSFVVDKMVLTGDALMIRGTGRTDFQQGSASRLYRSVHEKLFVLPDETLVYPAHDYKGQTHSTIGLEKRFNPRLGGGKTEAEYVQIMADLKLAPPKRIDVAVPANLRCGAVLS